MAKRSGPDPFDFSNSEVLESYPWAKERALRYETENDPRNREAKGWAFIKALVDDGVELSDEDQINILNDFIRTGGTTYSVPEPTLEESVAAPVSGTTAPAEELSPLRQGLRWIADKPALPGSMIAGTLEKALGSQNNPDAIREPTEGDLMNEKINLITEGQNAELTPDQLAQSYYEREIARRATTGGTYSLEDRLNASVTGTYYGVRATEAMEDAAEAYNNLLGAEDQPLTTFKTTQEQRLGTTPSDEVLEGRKRAYIAQQTEKLNKAEAAMQKFGPRAAQDANIMGRDTALGIASEGMISNISQAPETAFSLTSAYLGGRVGGKGGAATGAVVGTLPMFNRALVLKQYEVKDSELTPQEQRDYARLSAAIEFAPQAVMSAISGGTIAAAGRTSAGSSFINTVMPEIKEVLGRFTSSRGAQLALATMAEAGDELAANELRVWADKQIAEKGLASTPGGQEFFDEQVAENQANRARDAIASAVGGGMGGATAGAPLVQLNHMQRQAQAAKAVDALTKSMENDLSIIDAVNAGMEATTRETPSGVEQPTDIPTRVDVELNQDIAFEEERIRNEESRTRAFEQAEAERKLQEEQDELSREAGLQTLERGGGSIGGGSRVERYGGPTRGTENVPGTPAARGDGIVERVEIAPAQEVRPEDVAAQREEAAAQERERQQRAEQGGRIERIRKRQEELKKKEADKQKKEESKAAKEADNRRQTIIDQAIAENPDATPAELDQIVEARMMEPAPDPRPAQQAEALRKKIRSARGRIGRGAKPSDKAETRRIEGWLKANPDATDDQAVAALMPGAPRAAAPAPRQTAQQPSAPQQTPAPAPTKPDSEMSDAEVDAMADRYASLGMAAQEDAQGNRRVNTPENRAKAREIARALVHSSHVGSRGVQELIMQGRLKIVPNASSIGLPNKRRAAEYDVGNDMMYVYSDHLTNPSDATAAIVAGLHEATHSGQFAGSEARRELYRAFLGDDKTSQAAAILRDAAKKGNVLAAEAVRKAQADTAARQEAGEANPSRFEDLELVAYFTGEVAASRGTTLGSLGGAMRDITTAARSWVRESFPGLDLKITAGDLNTAAAFVGQEVASDARQGDSTSTVGGRANTDTGEEDEQLGMLGGAQATGFSQAQQQGRTFAPAVDRLERFEFGDDRAELTTDSTVWQAMTEGEVVPLNEVWSHPEFEEQYPDLANSLTVEVDPNMPASVYGTYLNGKISVPPTIMQALRADREDVRNTLLHEVQHAIQELEGFVPGTNKENFIPAVVSQMRDYDRQRVATMEEQFNLERAVEGLTPEARQRWEASGFADSDSAASWFMSEGYHKETSNPNDVRFGDRYQEALKNLRKSNKEYMEAEQRGFRIYLRDRGEAEARNVEARSRMTQTERDALPFESTIGEDIGADASELLDTTPFVGRPERAPIASEELTGEQPVTLGMSFDPPDSPAFKSWFGDSKIKYSDGGPITMWHGSARDAADLAQRFARGENRRSLFFVSPSKRSADAYAGMTPDGDQRSSMPMYIRAENPWDFALDEHVDLLWNIPEVRDAMIAHYQNFIDEGKLTRDEVKDRLAMGDWELIELPQTIAALKDAGHDAVYVFEENQKNLGLFSPNQMKHATDNSGEFSESGDFLGMAAAETNTSTEGFRRWWKQSVTTNPDGSPRKLFHGTTSDVNFSEFRIGDAEIGIHVGTVAQANDPAFVGPIYGPGGLEVGLAQLRKGGTGGESPRVFPLYASIQNPLRVPDMFAGFAADVADGIAQGLQNVNNNSLANTILDLAFEWDRQDGRDGLATSSDVQVNKGRLAELRAALQGAGYDGLVYTNKSEGTRDIRAYPQGTATPEDSYVVFNPNQLKSTTNSGDFSRYTNDTLGMHIPTAEEAASVTKRAIVNMFRNDKGLGEDVLNLVELAKSSPAYDSMAAETLVRDYQNALDDLADERGVDSRALSREIADKLEEAAKDTTKPSENKAAWANTLAEYGKVGEVLMDMRNRADRLAIEILSLREQQGGDMTPDEVRAYKAVAANLGRYVHRMYAAGSGRAGKKFGRAMWKAHMKQQAGKTLTTTEAHNAATVERAINVLADQLTIPDNEGLYTLDQHDLESLYNTWINPSATAVDSNTMIDRLAEARDVINGDSDRIRNQAEQVAKDLLNLLKKDPTTPLGKFYRGGKLDRGILKKRKNIAAPLRELMGEIRDPGIALLGTIGKQAEFVARNKLLLKMRNMVGEDLQPPSAAGTRIQTDNEMTPLEGPDFGPLQGWYASPYMHSMLNSTVQQLATLEQAMSNINAQPGDLGDVIWRNIGNTWRQVASKTKALSILGNPTLFLVNFVGSFDTMLQNGNYTSPETQLQALREAGQLIAYAVNPALSTDSTRLLAKYGVIDNAQIGELKNMNYKQIQNHIKSLISDGGRKRNIAWGVLRGYKETYAMMDVWAKIANFHQNVKDLTAYNEAEGGKWSQDEIYQRAAASTKRTNFTYGRAAPFIKALERNGVTMFGTYFYEVFRTQAENIREIDRDLALAEEATTPEARKIMRQRAAKRGLGIAASNAIKLGAAQMLAKLLFGDDEEKWYNIRGLLPEFLRGQDFIPVGRDEEGNQVVWPFSRFDPYGPATDIVRDILHGNGSPEEITNSLRDLYITPRVASIVVSNLAGRGRESTFQQVAPGVYGEVVNIAGRRAGLVKAVTNIAEAFAPGAINSWRDNNVRIQPRENDGTIGGAVMSTVDQLALYSSYVGNRMYKLDPNESIKYAGFEYKDFDTEAKKEVKEYLKSQTEPTVENLEKLVYDITKQEYAEWEKLRRIYKGMLDIGIPEDEADAIIGESPLSKAVQASVIDGVFTPNAVSIRSLESVRDNLMKNQTAAEKERIKEKWDIMIELMSEVLDD